MKRSLAPIALMLLCSACECGGEETPRRPSTTHEPEVLSSLDPTQMVAGPTFTCALRGARVVCWGVLDLLPDTSGAPSEPVLVEALGEAVELAGDSNALLCVRGTDRVVRCGFEGRAPIEVESLAGAVSLAATGGVLCGVVGTEGVCLRLGDVGLEELLTVDGATGVRATPVGVVILRGEQDAQFVLSPAPQGGSLATLSETSGALDAGGGSTPCVVTSEGEVRCATSLEVASMPAPGGHPWTLATQASEALGRAARLFDVGQHLCAADAAGRLRCEDSAPDFLAVLTQVEAPVRALAGDEHVCLLRGEGELEVWCWGDDVNGQAGRVPSSPSVPSRVAGLPPVTDVAVQADFACALTGEGALYCWDSGVFSATPVAIGYEGPRLDALVRAGEAVCARDSEGAVQCVHPQRLNQGLRRVEGLDASAALIDGGGRACGVDAAGHVACFGSIPLPQAVSGMGRADEIVAGTTAVWARRGAAIRSSAPVEEDDPARALILAALADAYPMPLPIDAARMFAGAEQFFWIDSAGALRAAGHNGSGQLGLPPSPPVRQSTPVTLPELPAGMSFAAHASCAWTEEGPVRCAGLDERLVPRDPRFGGARGDGSWRQLPGLTGIAALDQGARMGCAVLRNGELRCWGVGPRGDGSARTLGAPTRVTLPR